MQHNKLTESEKARVEAHHEKLLSAEKDLLAAELKQFISGLPEDLAPDALNQEIGVWAVAQYQAAKDLEKESFWKYKAIDPLKDWEGFQILSKERTATYYLVEATWSFAIDVGAIRPVMR